MGTPWERADVEREHIENSSATVTPREHLGSLRKNGITGTRWARKHRGNAVGMPWAWDSGNALNAWRRPWEHLGNALGMGTHWEHLGNGLTLNGYTIGRCSHIIKVGNTGRYTVEVGAPSCSNSHGHMSETVQRLRQTVAHVRRNSQSNSVVLPGLGLSRPTAFLNVGDDLWHDADRSASSSDSAYSDSNVSTDSLPSAPSSPAHWLGDPRVSMKVEVNCKVESNAGTLRALRSR